VKAHAICGVKTNIVTAVEIAGREAGNCPMFKPLVEKTAENFTVKEVPADKAYLSHDNLELVEGLGGTAYVPFKSTNVAGEAVCVGETRRVVLEQLSRHYARPLANHWEFVRFAHEQHLDLDLTTPPKRPARP
jgi:hypothetical protein